MSPGGKRRGLLAVWLVLAVLVGVIVALERTDLVGPQPKPDGHGSVRARLLLPVPVDQLGAVEVVYAGTLHRFERDTADAWLYHAHAHDVALGSAAHHRHDAEPSLAACIAYAFAAFGRTRIERRFALTTPAEDYGVVMPEMLILVYRRNSMQPLAQYAVGDLAPDTLSRYVLIVGRSAVVTIPNYQIDNLLTLLKAVAGQSGARQIQGKARDCPP